MKNYQLAVLSLSIALSLSAVRAGTAGDDNFDRLDGTGRSGKRVDVIEWEGNLEIHVYPAGSLKGLALKLDKKPGTKEKVMVIGYRFANAPDEQLVRRAILGIPISENFQVFRDPSADEYDKIVVSNNGLAKPLVAFKTEGAPAQLYPDGHPANERGLAGEERDPARERDKKQEQQRRRAKSESESQLADEDMNAAEDEEGRVQPFFMKRKTEQGRTVRGARFDP